MCEFQMLSNIPTDHSPEHLLYKVNPKFLTLQTVKVNAYLSARAENGSAHLKCYLLQDFFEPLYFLLNLPLTVLYLYLLDTFLCPQNTMVI